jgi:hypothetical protein
MGSWSCGTRHARWRRAVDKAGEPSRQCRVGSALLGRMTLDVHSHLWPDSEERSRSAIDAVLGSRADFSRTAEA